MSIQKDNIQSIQVRNRNTPLHFMFAGVLIFLIYFVGVYDFIMIHSNNKDYINSLNVKGNVISYFSDYPLSYTICWSVNVFGGLLAAVLLFFKTKWVVSVAFIVVVSKLILDILTFLFRDRWDVFGPQESLADLAVLVITFLFYIYCRIMLKRGILV